VVRRERLTQRAGVELFHFVVGQIGETFIAEVVCDACLFEPFRM
jgi:hypothetical protein